MSTNTTTADTTNGTASHLEAGGDLEGDDLDDLDDGIQEEWAEPRNLYGSVYEFVEFIAALYAHEVSEQQTSWRWCSHWYHHTEAVARLEACWKAFEVLRQDPGTGASVWFRDHADPCMNTLTAPNGPFAKCSDTSHKTHPRSPSPHHQPGNGFLGRNIAEAAKPPDR